MHSLTWNKSSIYVFHSYTSTHIPYICAGIRGLGSYVNYKGGLVSANDNFKAKDEIFAEYA